MRDLKDRIERLERVLDGQEAEQLFVIVLCGSEEDIRLSHEFGQWLTHGQIMASVSGPPWGRTAIADCSRERAARLAATRGRN